MARIRKSTQQQTSGQQNIWRIGKYIRLSREDGNEVSESVVNQNKILDDELPHFFETGLFEVVDTYIDDGTSGTTDLERRDFQRMVQDMKDGRINCIIVKNLSRAFRNSANQGHFLEEFIPLYHTRFISLYQPRIDTFLDPEVVHSLEVSITGFMNEQYAYKTSADVRRTFRYKRERGEFIGAFAPYGYVKDPDNKNALLVDEDAAQVVQDIFSWFVTEGLSKGGICRRLNELGIPNPTAYKRSKGFRYENPRAKLNDGLWGPATVTRILQDPLFIGVMRQGRQKVISYKIHKRTSVPESEWFLVEDAVPAIVSHEIFQAAQALHKRDSKISNTTGELHLFSGFVRCADCKKGMRRGTAKGLVYYSCRTYREKSKQKCSKHTIREDILENVVLVAIQKQIELVGTLSQIIAEINKAPVVHRNSERLEGLLKQHSKDLDKTRALSDSLYMDWKNGDLSHEQYRRMKGKLEEHASHLEEMVAHIQDELMEFERGVSDENPYLTTFLRYRNIQSLTRGLLIELVDTIYIHGDGHVEIIFNFADQHKRILEFVQVNQMVLDKGKESTDLVGVAHI